MLWRVYSVVVCVVLFSAFFYLHASPASTVIRSATAVKKDVVGPVFKSLLQRQTKDIFPLLRKKRNTAVTTEEFSANKQLLVSAGSGNPERFSVSVNGNSNTSVYDVTIVENITGLQIIDIVEPPNPTVESNLIIYQAGNLSNSDSLRFSYSATLSNLGSEVGTFHGITTTITYYTTPQFSTRRSLTLSVCIQKVINVINNTCDWCWYILIFIVCFIVGFILTIVAAIVWELIKKSFSHHSSSVVPFSKQENISKSVKSNVNKNNNGLIGNILDIVFITNEREIQYGLELLELQKMLELEKVLNFELVKLEEIILEKIAKERKYHNWSFDGDDEIPETASEMNLVYTTPTTMSITKEEVQFFQDHQDLLDQSDERKNEIEEWKLALCEFPDEFQTAMMELVFKRHNHNVANEKFLRSLKQIIEICKDFDSSARKDRDNSKENYRTEQRLRTHSQRFLNVEDLLLKELLKIYTEHSRRIREINGTRGINMAKIVDVFNKEKLIWDKLIAQHLSIVRIARRQNLITNEKLQEIEEKIRKRENDIKEKFLKEQMKIQNKIISDFQSAREKCRRSSSRHNSFEVKVDNLEQYIRETLDRTNQRLKNDLDMEEKLDLIAFRYDDAQSSIITQSRKELRNGKEILSEFLTESGVEEDWLEEILEKKRKELSKFYDEIEVEVAGSLAPADHIMTSQMHDFTDEILRRVNLAQATSSKWNSSEILYRKINRQKSLLKRSVLHQASKRYNDVIHDLKKKKKALGDVLSSCDEDGIKRELEEKLRIVVDEKHKKETKKANARAKRHLSIASRNTAQTMLCDQLLVYLRKSKEELDLSKERNVVEELTITSLQLMTSSGKLTSRDCRMILDELRSKAEEIKRKYGLEKKKREEELRRKTEKFVLQTKYASTKLGNSEQTLHPVELMLNRSNLVIMTKSKCIDDERMTVQDLFELRKAVEIEKEKSLLGQEIFSLQQLVTLMGIDIEEIKESIQLLLPDKPVDAINKLAQALCNQNNSEKKSNSKAFQGELLRKSKQIAERKLKSVRADNQYRSLSQRSILKPSGNYPAERPEPLGRNATSENLR